MMDQNMWEQHDVFKNHIFPDYKAMNQELQPRTAISYSGLVP